MLRRSDPIFSSSPLQLPLVGCLHFTSILLIDSLITLLIPSYLGLTRFKTRFKNKLK